MGGVDFWGGQCGRPSIVEDESHRFSHFLDRWGDHAGKHERDWLGLVCAEHRKNGPDDNMQVLILQVTTAGTQWDVELPVFLKGSAKTP